MTHISKKLITIDTGDAWRPMIQPVNAVGGANDTGQWDDSPCPSPVRQKEIKGFCELLKKAGIKYATMWCNSANVFMARNFVLVQPSDHAAAYTIAEDYSKQSGIRLFYPCKVETKLKTVK